MTFPGFGVKTEQDFDRALQVVQDNDPYGHLRSIHNFGTFYDHNKPTVTHASIQKVTAVEAAGRAVLYRDVYRKPIVSDEVKYEGDIPERWGSISAEEMVHHFWQGAVAGAYVSHGATYAHPDDILWWAEGGVLHGESPARIRFLKDVLETAPSGGWALLRMSRTPTTLRVRGLTTSSRTSGVQRPRSGDSPSPS
ncbi:hypothetical protein [Streptodolium elevatio]